MNTHSGQVPKNESAVSHLDSILATLHLIPQQNDIRSLLRMLRYCSLPAIPFQRICLFIETPLPETSRLCSVETRGDGIHIEDVNLPLGQGCYELCRQTEVRLLGQKELLQEFPALAAMEQFEDVRSSAIVPLTIPVNGYHCALTFTAQEEGAFDAGVRTICQLLSGVIAVSLSRILQMEEMRMETAALRHERDQLSMLLGTANVAYNTFELDTMLDMVAMDLRRFFAISDVALLVREEGEISCFVARNQKGREEEHLPRGVRIPAEKSLMALTAGYTPGTVLDETVLRRSAEHDPVAASFLNKNSHFFCAFPLVIRTEQLGALLLAHRSKEVFSQETKRLGRQIALNIAGAVRNARDYSSVATEKDQLKDENLYLSSELKQQLGDGDIVGNSPAIRAVLAQVELVAPSDSTVLVLGETGTGKELVAEAVHKRSPRAAQRMIKLNCAAVPAGLLESELFGHEKGAFTGAVSQSKGRFELAQGGTLFLDEIGDIPLELQPKLLRILQSRELERLGGSKIIPLDVRVVAATNRDLKEMVEKKEFRDDLYYRLNVFPIRLPPLRERREDIPLLVQHFTSQLARRMGKTIKHIPKQAMRWLVAQDWPGNIRELANVIERAVILSRDGSLVLDQATEFKIEENRVERYKERPDVGEGEKEEGDQERREIVEAVRASNGLISGPRGAALLLGIKRTTLISRMKRLGLTVEGILNGQEKS